MSHARNAISTPILTELVRDELETVGRLSSVTDSRLRVAQSRAHRIVAVAVAPVALHSFSKVADRTPMRPLVLLPNFAKENGTVDVTSLGRISPSFSHGK